MPLPQCLLPKNSPLSPTDPRLQESRPPRKGLLLKQGPLPAVLLALSLIASTPAAAAPAATARFAAQAEATTAMRPVDLPAYDGVVLKGNLIAPIATSPHPAIIFISSWGLDDTQYAVQARLLAEAGYVVLSYTTRGFGASGGRIETAGPPDIADVSAALDWLIANTTADPDRIGVGGVSYGAGIALIAAGQDARIRAVVAISAWTDLVESLLGNNTRHPQAAWLLKFAAETLGRPSAELSDVLSDYFANRDLESIVEWGAIRSAESYLAGIRTNRPAILIANAYGDSLFSPNQLVDFFGQLTGPRRLELAPGDHVIPEATGLIGLPNHVWTSTRRWFDEYLAGVNTGIGAEPVVLRVRNAGGTIESYGDWPDVTGSTSRYHLGDVPPLGLAGPLTGSASTGWTETFAAGGDTVANAGVLLLSGGLEALTGTPATAWLPAVNRARGVVWSTGPLGSVAVRGIAQLQLSLRPAKATGTVVAYLYDADALGTGRLITHVPYTWVGASPGQLLTINAALPATAWNVPAGHRLVLVIDSADPLYFDANNSGDAISISGPSWIDIPLR